MPTSEPRRHADQNPSIHRVIIAALIGSALEWYDFSLYGVTAALVFAPLFFPTFSPVAGSLAAFATFAVGFLSRPLGGLVLSHFGDKIGRKPVLAATLILMGVSTCLIGLLPTFDQIGIWAPIALVLLRLIQGLGAGAEYGGAALLLAEQSPRRRGFYGAFAASGVFVGIALSLGVFSLVTSAMSQETLLSWGWRVPYLLSVVVVGVGLYLRIAMPETPEFARDVQDRRAEVNVPLWEALRNHPRRILLGMGINLPLVGYSYVLQTYVLTYITTNLGLSRNAGLVGVFVAAVLAAMTIPVYGALADRVGARQVIMVGAAGSALFAFPFFWMVDTRDLGHLAGHCHRPVLRRGIDIRVHRGILFRAVRYAHPLYRARLRKRSERWCHRRLHAADRNFARAMERRRKLAGFRLHDRYGAGCVNMCLSRRRYRRDGSTAHHDRDGS